VRHFIDLGRLSIQISMNGIFLRGSLLRLPGVTSTLTPEVVQVIMAELGRIQGVKRVNGELDNWTQDRALGAWVPVDKNQSKPAASTPTEESAAGIYDVTDKAE